VIERTFPLRTARWSNILLMNRPDRMEASVDDARVLIHMGWLGRAEIPLDCIARIDGYRWPWWGGYGVRIGKGLVAFVATPGAATLIELTRKITVHAPAPWDTQRIVVAVADPDGFATGVAEARRLAGPG
jgi:hypothetical protein